MVMTAPETTDSCLRACSHDGNSGPAGNLPCNANDFPLDSPHRSRSISGSTAISAAEKVPDYSHVELDEEAAHQVMQQTGCPPMISMERRHACSCFNSHIRPDMVTLSRLHNCCNCNMENCAWVLHGEHIESNLVSPGGRSKPQPWRSSPSPAARSFNGMSSSTNEALQRALAAMKKVSGEPEAVKNRQKQLSKGIDAMVDAQLSAAEGMSTGRCISSSDARTLSMRERGRWGNSKMQQQRSCHSSNQSFMAPSLSAKLDSKGYCNDHHRQQLHRFQCLHCGSFSTTPVSGGARVASSKDGRSPSFRRIRDYSWQQELHEQKKPAVLRPAPAGRAQDPQLHCEYARCPDFHEEQYIPAPGASPQHAAPAGSVHHHNPLSWQDRYMLLCQAIAAGAFPDGGTKATCRGYSWAACECSSCEMSSGGNFKRPASHATLSTANSERMMEVEAFSGPLGYVSESKGVGLMAEDGKRPPSRAGRVRWWARLPSFGKGKSERPPPTPAREGGGPKVAGQATAQCTACGERVWEEERRFCPECLGRGGEPPQAPQRGRPTATPSAAYHNHHHHINSAYKAAAAGSNKRYTKRWRLVKLCRYFLGFPMQR